MMSKVFTVCIYLLIISIAQNDSFKIISKIKNYLHPTTTSTTEIPVLPEYEHQAPWGKEATEANHITTTEIAHGDHIYKPGNDRQNETRQENPWGKETTEQNHITTTEIIPGDPYYNQGNDDPHKENPTATLLTPVVYDSNYMPTRNNCLYLPSDAKSKYPGMPTPTISDGETNELIPVICKEPHDERPIQNTTYAPSHHDLKESNATDNQWQHNGGSIQSENGNENQKSDNNQSGTINPLQGSGNSDGENSYEKPDSSRNPSYQPDSGNINGGNLYETPNLNGTSSIQQGGGNNDGGNIYELTNSNGTQESQQSGGNLYGTSNSNNSQSPPQSSGHACSGNDYGQLKPKNKTHPSSKDDNFIFPDDPLLQGPATVPEDGSKPVPVGKPTYAPASSRKATYV